MQMDDVRTVYGWVGHGVGTIIQVVVVTERAYSCAFLDNRACEPAERKNRSSEYGTACEKR
jgi:hypothetical protein